VIIYKIVDPHLKQLFNTSIFEAASIVTLINLKDARLFAETGLLYPSFLEG
jgi:hypothetical protein